MSQQTLDNFGAYRKSRELFDLVVEDLRLLDEIPACWKLIGQQIASADSICANLEEGHGRRSGKEYLQFLLYSRGSARETRGRYERLSHWLPPSLIAKRIELCDEIIAILTSTIQTLETRHRRPSAS